MSFLAALKPRPAVRRSGRHAPVSIVERLTGERDAAARQADELRAELAKVRAEMAARGQQYVDSAQGWEDALDFASEQFVELERLYDERGREIESLHTLLDARKEMPGTSPYVAPADDPQSCFSQPSPPPAPDSRRAEPFPDGPATYEIADVTAETQAVDVAALRDAEATQQLSAAALRNAAGLGATAVLPVVALEPARHPRPEPWPPARPTRARTLADVFGAADLKPDVTPAALPRGDYAVRFAKTH